jgi:AraC-like DNA-binding protein
MDNNSPIDLLHKEYNVNFVNALRQIWSKNKYSYSTSPRPNSGLLLVTEGSIEYRFSEKSFIANKGDIVFLPEKSYYEAYFDTDNRKVITMLINFAIKENDDSLREPKLILSDVDSKFSLLFNNIISTYDSDESDYFLEESYLYMLLYDIRCSLKDKVFGKEYEIVQKAVKLLENTKRISVKEIAAECFTNENNLRKLFKKYMGTSPNDYRIKIKIESAKRMLISTDSSIKEISYALGFYDEAYFYKIFFKKVGVTPKKYRLNYYNEFHSQYKFQ